MALRSGRFTIGPDDGTLLIRTRREGAAARMGHDLAIIAARWKATVTVDAEVPSRSAVSATVDAASLVVKEATGGPIGLTDSQKREIEGIVRDTVLRSDRHPVIRFRSTAVEGTRLRGSVTGKLTIRRRTRPTTLQLRVSRAKTARLTATASIVQTEFGITPYSALLGALRVSDAVEVVIQVRLPER